ncbi:MAG: hypothetical protein ACOX2F_06195 [bacterium]
MKYLSIFCLALVFFSCSDSVDFDPVELGACMEIPEGSVVTKSEGGIGEFQCGYVEVTAQKSDALEFNWIGEFDCGSDWIYGYEIAGVKEGVLKVTIKGRDTDTSRQAKCGMCCKTMPIIYKESAEVISSIKSIEIKTDRGKKIYDI